MVSREDRWGQELKGCPEVTLMSWNTVLFLRFRGQITLMAAARGCDRHRRISRGANGGKTGEHRQSKRGSGDTYGRE